jgi:hypothetical protein
MYKKLLWLLFLSLWLPACTHTQETTLANGLRVIVKEDHRSPVVYRKSGTGWAARTSPTASPASRMCSST